MMISFKNSEFFTTVKLRRRKYTREIPPITKDYILGLKPWMIERFRFVLLVEKV